MITTPKVETPELETPQLPKGYFFRVTPYKDGYGRIRPDLVEVQLLRKRRFWFSKIIEAEAATIVNAERIHRCMVSLQETLDARIRGNERVAAAWRNSDKFCGDYPPKKLKS